MKSRQLTFEQNRNTGFLSGSLSRLMWYLLLLSGIYTLYHVAAAPNWTVAFILASISLILIVPASTALCYRVFITLHRNPICVDLDRCLLRHRYVVSRLQLVFDNTCEVTVTSGYFSRVGVVYTVFLSGQRNGIQISQAVNAYTSAEDANAFVSTLESFLSGG